MNRLAKIIGIGALSLASLLTAYKIGENKGYVDGKVDLLVSQEFNKRYVWESPKTDAVASLYFEMREAFIKGRMPTPYFASRSELENLIKEGKRLREELRNRVK
jgi:hypothetical protein